MKWNIYVQREGARATPPGRAYLYTASARSLASALYDAQSIVELCTFDIPLSTCDDLSTVAITSRFDGLAERVVVQLGPTDLLVTPREPTFADERAAVAAGHARVAFLRSQIDALGPGPCAELGTVKSGPRKGEPKWPRKWTQEQRRAAEREQADRDRAEQALDREIATEHLLMSKLQARLRHAWDAEAERAVAASTSLEWLRACLAWVASSTECRDTRDGWAKKVRARIAVLESEQEAVESVALYGFAPGASCRVTAAPWDEWSEPERAGIVVGAEVARWLTRSGKFQVVEHRRTVQLAGGLQVAAAVAVHCEVDSGAHRKVLPIGAAE